MPTRSAHLPALLTALALFACDDPGDDPGDTGPPRLCQLVGCPEGQFCLDSGECVTRVEVEQAGERCVALAECLGPCLDQPCVDACARLAGPVAIDRYNALGQCLQFNDCLYPTGGFDPACLEEHCADEHAGCPFPLPAAPQGQARCGDFAGCLAGCPFDPPEAEQQCLDDCVRDASPAAYALYLEAIQCVVSQCPDGDPICQDEACGAEIDACFGQGLGTGSLPCDDVMECVFSCPDDACYERCEVDASPEAFALWRAFVDCAAPAGCGSYDACLVACPQEARACENDR